MSASAGPAEIGRWYRHLDKGETFQVVGYDSHADTIEIQTAAGDLDEIDGDDWKDLPLALAEPSEDWHEAADSVQPDDVGDSDSGTSVTNRTQPPAPLEIEARDDTKPDDGIGPVIQ